MICVADIVLLISDLLIFLLPVIMTKQTSVKQASCIRHILIK